MQVPFLDLRAQYATIQEPIRLAVDEVFASQQFILGVKVRELEARIAELCAVPEAIGVSSGSDALRLSLQAVGVGPGDSVITVPYTFFGTVGAIVHLGARPLFVDIDRPSYGMDPDRVGACIREECTYHSDTRKLIHRATGSPVRAILPVHLFGQCVDMDEILELARSYHLPVVEDSCQVLGATYKSRPAGSLGDVGCFSFFPSKNLGGVGDGGMVVTAKGEIAERVRLLRTHGAMCGYDHRVVGYNSRLDELQAAVLLVKLGYLEQWTSARAENARYYGAELADHQNEIVGPTQLPDRKHVYHQYVARCRSRDELRTYLSARGIETQIYYPMPLPEQEALRYLGYRRGNFPCAEETSEQALALPIYPELSDAQKDHVVGSIAGFYRQTG